MSLFSNHFKIQNLSDVYIQGEITMTEFALGGRIRNLANPMMLWFNGSTYAVGYKPNNQNNQVWAQKQTGDSIEAYTVGTGTNTSEPLNHPAPAIFIDDAGYIYVAQNEFHVNPFRLWRSDIPEDISSFTLLGSFDTNGSYLALIKQSNTNVTLTTRSGDNSTAIKGYDFSVLEVDLTNASYTKTLVVEMDFATNQVRAYLGGTAFYGTSNYRAYGLSSRREGTSRFYKYSIMWSDDSDTFYNSGMVFNKNVPATSAITYAELDTNYAFIGSDSAQTTDISACNMIQIYDDAFVSYRTGAGDFSIKKVNRITGTETEVALGLTLFNVTNGDNNVYLYYNGSNIGMTVKMSDEAVKIYTLETDLSGLTYVRDIENAVDGNYIGMPANLNDVPDGSPYLMTGRSSTYPEGVTPYVITTNKWFS
jgi:hypothetical protein